MPKPKIPSLKQNFDKATAISQQQKEIARLRQEVEKLRSIESDKKEEGLVQLREELKNYSGEQMVMIDLMRPSRQARQTFTAAAIAKRAESLRRLGQLNPVILVPSKDEPGYFDIEDGELRWRGANLNVTEKGLEDWKYLRAVIAPPPIDDRELHKRSLIHHLHREDLNPLDRIEAIISQIEREVNLDIAPEEIEAADGDREAVAQTKIKKIIRNFDYRFKTNPTEKNKIEELLSADAISQRQTLERLGFSEIQVQVLLVLLELQQNIRSIATNDLPMLNLPVDLKQAIRQQELPCHQAKAIALISADKLNITQEEAQKLRAEAILVVIDRNLSLKKTRELVEQILAENGAGSKEKSKAVKVSEVDKMLKKVKIANLTAKELNKLRESLIAKLNEIENYSAPASE